MDIHGLVRQHAARSRAMMNSNPGLSGNGERVDGLFYHYFDQDQTYNGEDFTAGSLLVGNNTGSEGNWLFTNGVMYYRSGTTPVFTQYSGGTIVGKEIVIDEVRISVTNGNINLDRQGYSNVRIVASTGPFTIQTISDGGRTGTMLYLTNDTTNAMTVENNSGVVVAGYSDVFTLDGSPTITKASYSYAELKFQENISVAGTYQWLLGQWRG